MGCTASSKVAQPQLSDKHASHHDDGFAQPQADDALPPPPTLLTDRFNGQNKFEVQTKNTIFTGDHVDFLSTSLLSYMQNARVGGRGAVGGYISNVQSVEGPYSSKGYRTIGQPDVEFSWACQQGSQNQPPNQDAWCVLNVGPELRLVVVTDGFGKDGHMVSNLAVELLPKLLLSTGKMRTEWGHACFYAFTETHRMLVKLGVTDGWDSDYSGCSAAVVLHDRADGKVRVASTGHCGISTGSFCGRTAQMWSEPQTGALGSELERLKEAGSKVHWDGMYNRIYCPDQKTTVEKMPIVSRCLCHNFAHRMLGVIPTPEVAEFAVSDQHHFLCVGSRGIWEFAELEDIMDAIGGHRQSPHDAAPAVVFAAHQLWLKNTEEDAGEPKVDDLTAIVMQLA